MKEFEHLQWVQGTIVLFLLHANIERDFYFLLTKGNLKLVVNSIRAHTSSPLVPTRCLLFLVTNGNLTILFFIWEQIVSMTCLLFLVSNGNLTLIHMRANHSLKMFAIFSYK